MLNSLLLLLFFILLQGIFSGMETGMISVRRPRVEHAVSLGSRSAKLILFFLNNPGIMISTTLLGVNISVVCASLAAKKFAEAIGFTSSASLVVMSSILSIMMLICEIVPKNWFRQAPCDRCGIFVPLLYWTYRILYLPAVLFDRITGFLSSRIAKKRKDSPNSSSVMRDELKLFLRESESAGDLPPEAVAILDHAVEFHAARACDIMRKKIEVVTADSEMSVAEAMDLCRSHNYSKLPVNDRGSGKWIGIFSIYHAFFHLPEPEWKKTPVSACMQKLFEADSKLPLAEMLKRTRGVDAAMYVILEDGRQAGILTSSDIVRRLFG